MKELEITPRGSLDAIVRPPGSKSITNRALLLAALSVGESVLDGVLDSEDTRLMFESLLLLGLTGSHDPESRRMTLFGTGGVFPNREADLYVGNSGTTARFLAAALTFCEGTFRIHGKPRMHKRPIRDLVEALKEWGGKIHCENNDGCPPVSIRGLGLRTERMPNRVCSVSGSISSQFLSALLMAAPPASRNGEVKIDVTGRLVSKPYIDMTLRIMEAFGVSPAVEGDFAAFRCPSGSVYRTPGHYQVEPDASAASYFFAAAAVLGGRVTIPGLSRNSLQGDVAFVDALREMGCDVLWETDSITVCRSEDRPLRGLRINMNALSDTAQTLAVVALFAEGATEIRDIEHVRHKETDRIGDLAVELRRFGATVTEFRDGLRIDPPDRLRPAAVETYDDHRMAMSFAVAGLKIPGVVIRDPDCVQKTFPSFFEELRRLT